MVTEELVRSFNKK